MYISTSPSTSVSLEYKYPLVQVPLYHLHMPTGPCTAVSLAYIYNHLSMHFCVAGIIYPLIHVPLCQWHFLWLGFWLALGGAAVAWLTLGMVCTIWVVADSLSLAGAATNIIFVATNTCLSLVCPGKLADKTCLLSWQKYACRDKTFVTTKLSWQIFVMKTICCNKRVCCNKTFVATKVIPVTVPTSDNYPPFSPISDLTQLSDCCCHMWLSHRVCPTGLNWSVTRQNVPKCSELISNKSHVIDSFVLLATPLHGWYHFLD